MQTVNILKTSNIFALSWLDTETPSPGAYVCAEKSINMSCPCKILILAAIKNSAQDDDGVIFEYGKFLYAIMTKTSSLKG
jgi:hypothetical protein